MHSACWLLATELSRGLKLFHLMGLWGESCSSSILESSVQPYSQRAVGPAALVLRWCHAGEVGWSMAQHGRLSQDTLESLETICGSSPGCCGDTKASLDWLRLVSKNSDLLHQQLDRKTTRDQNDPSACTPAERLGHWANLDKEVKEVRSLLQMTTAKRPKNNLAPSQLPFDIPH